MATGCVAVHTHHAAALFHRTVIAHTHHTTHHAAVHSWTVLLPVGHLAVIVSMIHLTRIVHLVSTATVCRGKADERPGNQNDQYSDKKSRMNEFMHRETVAVW